MRESGGSLGSAYGGGHEAPSVGGLDGALLGLSLKALI
jgi:hypothetical protein